MIRYRFSDFTLSPQRRLLVREGREVPLIPRYFDLLVLLIERRHEAVHRREIFELVWIDTSVSDSALSQAIRTIRRALGDDSREPRFIRTVSRHGYRFVLPDVIEEEDDGGRPASPPDSAADPVAATVNGVGPLVEGTTHATARAFAGNQRAKAAEPIVVAATLDTPRWSVAAAGGALAGIAAGGIGGMILAAAPDSAAPIAIAPVLAVIGGVCGALGAAGVGAGLSLAEANAGSHRTAALIVAAALGGGLAGTVVQLLSRWGLAALLGLDVDVGGGIEGLAIGAAAGAGYVFAAQAAERNSAAPRAGSRLHPALVMAVLCGLAGLALTLAGYHLVAGTIHAIADAAEGSRATLAPLGRLIGERDFGPVSGAIIAFGEAATFGLGLAYGLMRRPPV